MNSDLKKKVFDISGGLLINISDIVLFSIYLFGSSIGKPNTSRGVYSTFQEAHEILGKFNTRTLISTLKRLRYDNKYLNIQKSGQNRFLKITDEGMMRLQEAVPFYRTDRGWDGYYFFINFDIPEKNRRLRLLLRNNLKRVGGGLVQDSLWITPYNPESAIAPLREYLKGKNQLLCSKAKESLIYLYGYGDMMSFIRDVYHLDTLGERYAYYIENFKKRGNFQNIFAYLNILKDDPQLPFELEPDGFKAREAYHVYRKLVYKPDPPGPHIYTK